jgi:hypothetical protein
MRKCISLKFNKNFYPEWAIKEALSNYKRIAELIFSEQKKYFSVEISEYRMELAGKIGDEFSNHVLSLIGK